MQLYYSGALDNNLDQTDPSRSLGGYVSSSPVPNGRLNNLFSAFSRRDVEQQKSETKLIVLHNSSGTVVNDLKIWVAEGDYFSFKIAAVTPALDNCQNPVFESLQKSEDLPYQAVLEQKDSETNCISITTLAIDAKIGIWISREFKSSLNAFKDAFSNITDEELINLLQNNLGSIKDESSLIIDWS